MVNSQPAAVERRRRLLTRTVPITVIAVIAFILGATAGKGGSPELTAADRFVSAWMRGNFAAMYSQLNVASRRAIEQPEFKEAYREAAEVATLRGISDEDLGDSEDEGDTIVVPVEIVAATVAFGPVEGVLEVPYADGGVAWEPHLVFPGLLPGEHLENRVELADRASILARDGSPLAEGPAGEREHPLGGAAIDVTGEVGTADDEDLPALARRGFPPGTLVGVTGLEQAFNSRLAGRPGGSLLAVDEEGSSRILAKTEPRPGAPVKTTIDPELQQAAVSALAGRSGGIAVLDTRRGDIRALAGFAFSAPQPPGSTFKLVTTTAALEKGVVAMDDYFEIVDGVTVGGRFISNANGEFCGGTFPEAFAESCNADFAPLGPKIGNDELVEETEEFGWNSPPTLYSDEIVELVEPAESTIPSEIGSELDLAVSAIGQGEVLATPLQMASVAQTIANGGVRLPTSIVANRKLRPDAGPVRVMPKRIAAQLTGLMVGVVDGGTGFAAAIPEAQVAGKTGTAELGPKPGQEDSPEPEQIKDAWFTAFAPAKSPRLAVAVMLIEAEAAGGEVAAPAAGAVLSAGL